MHKLSKARLLGSVNGTMAELCDAVGGIGVDCDRNKWGRGVGRKCLGSQHCDGGDNCIWIVGT